MASVALGFAAGTAAAVGGAAAGAGAAGAGAAVGLASSSAEPQAIIAIKATEARTTNNNNFGAPIEDVPIT